MIGRKPAITARALGMRRLHVMLLIVITPTAIILAYMSWVYRALPGPVTSAYIEANCEARY
jgi:cytochrome bd-type quinol oxidase subunit 2